MLNVAPWASRRSMLAWSRFKRLVRRLIAPSAEPPASARSSLAPTITTTFRLSSNTGIFLLLGPTDPGALALPVSVTPPAKLPRPVTSTSTCWPPVGAAPTVLMLVLLTPVWVSPEKVSLNFTKSSPESMYLDKEYLSEIPRLLGVMSAGDKSMVMSSPMIRPLALAMSSTSRREMACFGLVTSIPNNRPVLPLAPEMGATSAIAVFTCCCVAPALLWV